MNRYEKMQIVLNNLEFYKKQFDNRNVKFIRHFRPTTYLSLTDEFLATLEYIEEVWASDTKLYKLASKYYSDVTLWWVIGVANNKPTDTNWQIGDIVKIPVSPQLIISATGV
jgi:hypothetical protein